MIQVPNEASAYTEGKHVVALRRRFALGQQAFADRFGLSVGTVRD